MYGYPHGYPGGYYPSTGFYPVATPYSPSGADGADQIRTVFITGFPEDTKERELNNLMRFIPGYQASQMTWKNNMAQGFALFDSPQAALQACAAVAGCQFDEGVTLRCEMARKNMFTKDDGSGGQKRIVHRPFPMLSAPPFPAPGPLPLAASSASFSIITANDGTPLIPVHPTSFAQVNNVGDNPPCSTLFIGNLGDGVSEVELKGLFAVRPGFKQLKLVRSGRNVTAFVEFNLVEEASAVHSTLQGAILPSSDRGPIRIQYSKNPFGKRRDE